MSISELLAQAVELHQAGRLVEAEQLYLRVLQDDFHQADAWHLLGVVQSQLGKHQAGAECIQRAIGLNGEIAAFHGNLGVVYFNMCKFDEAVACYRQALKIVPDYAEAQENLQSALKEQAKQNERLFAEAAGHVNSGRFQEAEQIYRRLLERGFHEGKVTSLLAVTCFQMGRMREALQLFETGRRLDPNHEDAHYNFAIALEKMGETERVLATLHEGLRYCPESLKIHRKLGWLYLDAKDYDRAIRHNRFVIERQPADYKTYGDLVTAHWSKGENERAIEYGRKALSIKDEICCREYRTPTNLSSAEVTPLAKSCPRQGKQIIAFSLWGDLRTYTEGAIRNAELALELYPDWVARFYCAASVPEDVRKRLAEMGAQVYLMPTGAGGYEGAFWRFFVADDPQVERFACRDCDSRLNLQEKAAVDEWLASGRRFHLMRDAIVHCDLILAGLWGGVTGQLPSLQGLFRQAPAVDYKWADQDFLARHIWPLVKERAWVHDTYYGYHGGRPFPKGQRLKPPDHVGAGFPLK